MAEWDAAQGRLKISGAAKVPFFNRRILAKQIDLPDDAIEMVENDVGGGFGARGEFYPEDFLDSVRGAPGGAAGQMDRGPARKSDGDEPCARGRVRCRDRLRARRHHSGAARPRLYRHGRLYAHQRRGWRAQHRAIHGRSVSHPGRQVSTSRCWMTNKTPVGTYRGPGRFETDFFRERLFDIVAQDLGIDRVEFRRRNLISHAEMPYPIATITPFESKDQYDSGDYQVTLDRCLQEIGWAEKAKLQGQADRRPLSRAGGRLLHRGRRGRAEGKRAARHQRGRLGHRLHGLIGGRAGGRDGVRADRRRRARNSDGPDPRTSITDRPPM